MLPEFPNAGRTVRVFDVLNLGREGRASHPLQWDSALLALDRALHPLGLTLLIYEMTVWIG